MDSGEVVTLFSTNHRWIPSGLPEEDVRETTLKSQDEPTEDLQAGLIPDKRGSGGNRGSESSEHYEGPVECERDATEGVAVETHLFDHHGEACNPELEDGVKESACDLEEPEAELHGDVDETSETESAQETMEAKNSSVHKCQSMEDLLDSTLLDVSSKSSKTELLVDEPLSDSIRPEADHRTAGTHEEVVKGFGNGVDLRFAQANEFDLCCHEEQLDLLNHNLVVEDQRGHNIVNRAGATLGNSKFDPILHQTQQSFLGFTVPSLPGDPAGPHPLTDVVKEASEALVGCKARMPVESSHDKNEINIMEAIMDSNEWLSTGPPDIKDLPWLTQTMGYGFKTSFISPPSSIATYGPDTSWVKPANVSHGLVAEEKGEGFVVAPGDVVIDEEDSLNKKVAAVSPMPQMVQVNFRVHYVTHSPSQLLAVTGNQPELGAWKSFVPLRRVEDWFWANSVSLPTETQVEWKFVLVEDGKIRRWEECGNRRLVVAGQEEEDEVHLDRSWGYM